jgi:hypothetical protein
VSLQRALAGAGPQIEVGVEGVEPEEAPVPAVAGRRTRHTVTAHAEVVAPLDRCGLSLAKPLGVGVERPA